MHIPLVLKFQVNFEHDHCSQCRHVKSITLGEFSEELEATKWAEARCEKFKEDGMQGTMRVIDIRNSQLKQTYKS